MPEISADAPSSELREQHGLRRQLGVRDLVLAQILCVVGSSWVGVAGGLGRAQALTWVAAMILFYFPMAAVVVVLNREMPLEGGLYVWAHRAFGDLGGFLTAWNLWVYGIAVTATILNALPTEISYLIGPEAAWLPENQAASIAIVAVILVALTVSAVRGLEWGKWIQNAGGLAMMTVFVALILLPLWGLWTHKITRGMELAPALPPMNLRSMALFGQMLVGALSGLEYIAIFAGESRQPARSIARSVWIASPVICLMFILGTSAVVAFQRPEQIDFIAPIPQTLRIALGNSGVASGVAVVAILLVQMRLLGATSYLFAGVTRLPMAVGWDALVPRWFSKLHPVWRTPVNSILCMAVLVMAMVVLGRLGVHAQEANQVLSNASETHYELMYMAMFAIPMAGTAALRKRLPAWLKWVSAVGFCATLYSFLTSAFPFVDVVNPLGYAAKILGTVAASNALALGYFLTRRRSRGARG